MKLTSQALPAVFAMLTAATVLAAVVLIPTPQSVHAAQAIPSGAVSQAPALLPVPKSYPAPTNLQVLPKDLTGAQVHEIMEQWEAGLGVHCGTCHAADPKNIGPNGKPRLNYADDSREEKATARLMFTLSEEINKKYIAKIKNSGVPVTCGTCHRGHMGPEPFVPPVKEGKPAVVPVPLPAAK